MTPGSTIAFHVAYYFQGDLMIATIKKFFAAYKKAASVQALEESYRDDFEREALYSGDFQGVRFTRSEDGKYVNARLESTWRDWVTREIWEATAI